MPIPLTAREPVEFTPPSLPDALKGQDPADAGKNRVRIICRVPTMLERDTYHATLVRSGFQVYTKRQIRDLSLAGVQELFPAEEHEDKRALLEELWAHQDAHEKAGMLEIQIFREENEKATAKGKKVDMDKVMARITEEAQPEVVLDRSRLVDGNALIQEIIAGFGPVQQAVGAVTEQDARRAQMNVRLYVVGWTGLEHEPDPPSTGGLKAHEIEYLRGQIGRDAFGEVSDFISAMMTIDEDEEKNLASLLENMSAPIGSTPLESKASSEVGNSTGGPSTTTPESGSRKTTGSSSGSSTSSRTRKAGPKRGRTAGAS